MYNICRKKKGKRKPKKKWLNVLENGIKITGVSEEDNMGDQIQ